MTVLNWLAATVAPDRWSPQNIVALAAALSALGATVMTYRSAGRASAIEGRKAGLAELEVIITQQGRQIDRLQAENTATQRKLTATQRDLAQERSESQVLRAEVAVLQGQVAVLQRAVNEQDAR